MIYTINLFLVRMNFSFILQFNRTNQQFNVFVIDYKHPIGN